MHSQFFACLLASCRKEARRRCRKCFLAAFCKTGRNADQILLLQYPSPQTAPDTHLQTVSGEALPLESLQSTTISLSVSGMFPLKPRKWPVCLESYSLTVPPFSHLRSLHDLFYFLRCRHFMMPLPCIFHHGRTTALRCICNNNRRFSLTVFRQLKRMNERVHIVAQYGKNIPSERCPSLLPGCPVLPGHPSVFPEIGRRLRSTIAQ